MCSTVSTCGCLTFDLTVCVCWKIVRGYDLYLHTDKKCVSLCSVVDGRTMPHVPHHSVFSRSDETNWIWPWFSTVESYRFPKIKLQARTILGDVIVICIPQRRIN